ncbi:undecaprenyl-diphosphatase UppP [Candidatus Kapabacteria bacterium]|nr:undecaprenyl-diphosphatase UppP [Candidatus Kapabacteria bacterium]
MSILEAILLGIVQGLSEFIPISSTAHLTIVGKWLDLIDPNKPESWTAFIAVVQIGTLLAVLLYFYKDIMSISKAFLKENLTKRQSFNKQSSESKMGWLIVIGSVPIVTIGLALKPIIESNITKDLNVIGTSLIILAIILFVVDKLSKRVRAIESTNIKDALIIGLAQCVALIPGSSRSGTTLTAGLLLGLKRDAAAKFSFLLGIPAILGSGLLELYSEFDNLQQIGFLEITIATIASAISGWLAIDFLLKFLKKNSTLLFVVYRILAGIFVLSYFV